MSQLTHYNGPIFRTTNTARLIQALERRGWWRGFGRGGRECCRMWRNDEVISVGSQGTIVATGKDGAAVLHELTQIGGVLW